jgi:hypothetical protein
MHAKHILAVMSAALLMSVAVPATALDLGVGGISIGGGSGSGGGGTAATVGFGDASAGVTIGGGTNYASASTTAGDSTVNLSIGGGDGPLVTAFSNDGTTDADINLGFLGLGSSGNDLINGVTDPLGDLLDGAALPGDGGGGGGGGGTDTGGDFPGVVSPTELAGAYGSLSGGEQAFLRNRCHTVMLYPQRFDRDLIELCRIIARLQMPGG